MNSKEIAVSIIASAVMADIIGFGLFVYPSMAQQQELQQQQAAALPSTACFLLRFVLSGNAADKTIMASFR